MAGLLKRSSRNYLRRHPGQLTLALLGIALGVAVVVAIDLALESAFRSFELASEAMSGRTTHLIEGGAGGLDEKLYARLRVELGVRNVSPVIRDYVTLAQAPDERYTLYGIDPLIEKNFHAVWQDRLHAGKSGSLLRKLLIEPNGVLIGERTAQRMKLNTGDSFSVLTETGRQTLTVIDLIAAPDAVSEQLLDKVIIADIATAQELTGLYGILSHIELMLSAADQTPVLEKIRNAIPENLQITTVATQAKAMREMTDAFAVNLKALGLLSLLVGLFLIYNAMLFLVVQRRSLIGCLRALGVTRGEILKLILEEALLLAVVGTVVGMAAGILIGRILLPSVSTTLNSVYFPMDAGVLLVNSSQIIKAVALGIGATILAVLPPAFEATRVSPADALARSRLESGSKRLIQFSGGLGLFGIAAGLTLIEFSETSIRLSLAGIFLLLFGFALLTPSATLLLLKGPERLFENRSITGRLPVRQISAHISRTGIAMAALMVAVAATIGMDLMITSFRQTVSDWIATSLQGDMYVALSGNLAATGKAAKDRDLKSAIAALPGVAVTSSVLRTRLPTSNGSVPIAVFDLNEHSHAGFRLLQSTDKVWERFDREQGVLLTEAYAYHQRSKIGDALTFLTPDGPAVYRVIGIYADFSGDRGHIAMSRHQYLKHWPDLGFTGIGVYAAAHADLVELEKAVRLKLSAGQTVRSAHAIHEASMAVFEQTFAITETLRGLAAGIAMIGVFGALTALQLERARQMGILRAIGLTPGQLYRLIAGETGLMGLCAGLIALPVGYLVAYELIFVIYRRAFGWTMAFHFHPEILLQGFLLAFCAALLAGLMPARKMARTKPAEALREE
ncbi:MAG: ABC transporter permease [Methylococcaceae bacterium]|nr:ABC transporter permease [Methylococcaceae bacterium]